VRAPPGVFALLLAVRRQWHQEITAADITFDAAERRVTDLYTKAVEQLGSEKAPVRLGGLYALERLAQDTPSQRQTIVNVVCAYLRMPYTLPGDPPADDVSDTVADVYRERIQEREVRLAAQRILGRHLHPGDNPNNPVETFWTDIDLDLTEATLIDLYRCTIRVARFFGATLTGLTSLGVATFTGYADFGTATFTSAADFKKAIFADTVTFREANFTYRTEFRRASFAGDTGFGNATFTGNADFSGASFASYTGFDNATLPSTPYADSDTPSPWIAFTEAQFTGGVPSEVARFVSQDAAVEKGGIPPATA
jgi:hypothetical protein